uniref:transposase n=1 Tax=Proteiniclasticum sp. TaxID=2053595 RepID=UPI00289CCF6B
GNMENYFKETKLDFGLDHLCHSTFLANQAKAMILSVAYSLVNAMKQLVLPKEFSKSRMSTLRTIFIKIAGKTVSHAKKMSMRLCSSAPYKEAILKIFENIHILALG